MQSAILQYAVVQYAIVQYAIVQYAVVQYTVVQYAGGPSYLYLGGPLILVLEWAPSTGFRLNLSRQRSGRDGGGGVGWGGGLVGGWLG